MKKIKIYLFCKNKLIEWEINESSKENAYFLLDKKITLFKNSYEIPIVYKEDKYQLESSKYFKFSYENQEIERKNISDGDIFLCNFYKEQTKVVLFIKYESIYSSVFNKYYVKELNEVKIGKSDINHIVYEDHNVLDEHIVLKFMGDKCVATSVNGAVGCYVNEVKLTEATLQYGDVLFLYGFKCIYLGDCIAVNNPNNNVYSKLIKLKENQFDSSLPSKFSNFQKDTLINKRKSYNSNQKKSIILNPPKIDQQVNFKFLYYAAIPCIIICIFQILLWNKNFNIKYLPYVIVLNLFMFTLAFLTVVILNKVKINKKLEEYRCYLNSKSLEIDVVKENKLRYLNEKYPTSLECNELVNYNPKCIWSREIKDEDFLKVVIGKDKILLDSLSVESDFETNISKENKVYKEYKKVLDESNILTKGPIVISLREMYKLAIVGDMYKLYSVIKSFVLQLVTMHSYENLKLCFLLSEDNLKNINYIKEIPHVYSENNEFRYIASNNKELINIIYKIKEIFSNRMELSREGKVNITTHYVIFIFYKSNTIIDSFLKYVESINKDLGISIVLILTDSKNIDGYENVLEIEEDFQQLIKSEETNLVMGNDYEELEKSVNVNEFVSSLSRIKKDDHIEKYNSIYNNSIFDLYDIGKIDNLNIIDRWSRNNLLGIDKIPVAIKGGKTEFSININSKQHGPNGIIFGESGTGKTEFLKSFILSYGINFNPNVVNFIILKDKQNYRFNNLKKMPHVIQFLDKTVSEKQRLISLIRNEIKNRQLLFCSIKVTDIESYLDIYESYLDTKAVPYLVIVIDDVDKSDEKFIEELVSLHEYMKSVGICVIVSSKDSKLLKDNYGVLSKFNFKMCFTLSDIKDVTRIMESSKISNPKKVGLFNIKLSEYEIIEDLSIVFSNINYQVKNSEENIEMVDNCGLCLKKVSKTSYNDSKKNQEQWIVDKIIEVCENQEYSVDHIFNSSLRYLSIHDLTGYVSKFNGSMWEASKNKCSAIIGIVDDPVYQVQRFLNVDFKNFGNLFVYGSAGSGKSTLIKTLVYSLCCEYSPNYLNIYMVDINVKDTNYFKYAPHIKEVATCKEDINELFKKVLEEFQLRKDMFESLEISSLETYEEKTGEKLPYIILIIDSIQNIENDSWDYINFIKLIAKHGSLYGMYICITSLEYSNIENALSVYFGNKLVLRLNDESKYLSIFNKDLTIDSNNKGRGYLTYKDSKGERVLEFQVGLPIACENEIDLDNKLKTIFNKMNEVNCTVYNSSVKEIFRDGNIRELEVEYDKIIDDMKLEEYDELVNENKMLVQFLNDLESLPKNVLIMYNAIENSIRVMNRLAEYMKDVNFKTYLFGNLDEETFNISFIGDMIQNFTLDEINKLLNSVEDYLKHEQDKKVCIFIQDFDKLLECINDDFMGVFGKIYTDSRVNFILAFGKHSVVNKDIVNILLEDGITLLMNHEYDLNEDTFIINKNEKNMVEIN